MRRPRAADRLAFARLRPAVQPVQPDREDAGPARPATGPAGALSAAPQGDGGSAPCPAPGHAPHCLWLPTRPPNKFRARLVAKRLASEGYRAVADSDRVIVRLDDDAIAKLFGVAPEHARRPAGASLPARCVAALPEGAALPPRYSGLVGAPLLDDPACDL